MVFFFYDILWRVQNLNDIWMILDRGYFPCKRLIKYELILDFFWHEDMSNLASACITTVKIKLFLSRLHVRSVDLKFIGLATCTCMKTTLPQPMNQFCLAALHPIDSLQHISASHHTMISVPLRFFLFWVWFCLIFQFSRCSVFPRYRPASAHGEHFVLCSAAVWAKLLSSG